MATFQIAPSILSADFGHLADEMIGVEKAGIHRFHIDVMDGHFVPNLSMGPAIVKSVRPLTELPFDVHLMISNPESFLDVFTNAGANALIVHIEACEDIDATIARMKELGVQAGVAFKPDTPLETISAIAQDVDIILVMCVHPGFSGQKFLPESVGRVAEARRLLTENGSMADIMVDGGVSAENAGSLVSAGATILTASTSIYRAGVSVDEAVARLSQAAANP